MKTSRIVLMSLITSLSLATGCGKQPGAAGSADAAQSLHDMRVAMDGARGAVRTVPSSPSVSPPHSPSTSASSSGAAVADSKSTAFTVGTEDVSVEGTVDENSGAINFKFALKSEKLKSSQDVDSAEMNFSSKNVTFTAHSKSKGALKLTFVNNYDADATEETIQLEIGDKKSEIKGTRADKNSKKIEISIDAEKLSEEQSKKVLEDINAILDAPLQMMSALSSAKNHT